MSARKRSVKKHTGALAGWLGLASLMACSWVYAGGGFRGGAVGGVVVDATGVLANAEIDQRGNLRAVRLEVATPVPADMKAPTELRMVSLRALEAAIAQRKQKSEMPLRTDEINLLGGLTRIRYVFVYPDRQDIVLAGPGEGWIIDDSGNYVGAKSGAPMLQLDHLLVALRSAESAAQNVISCSIDPTQEGMQRFQAYAKGLTQFNGQVLQGIEDAIGKQTIKITGVPETSEFARIMLAADFRMKRLAMGLEQSPIKELPSYIQMLTAATSSPQNNMPRWWLAPNYSALLRDADGLAWELRGPGVKCMTEDSFFSETGARQQTGKANPLAQKWADTMTAHYGELSKKDPVFGQLRNIMDMAVVAALIVKENLSEKASYSMPLLMNGGELTVNELPAAKFVDTHASALKKGRNWVITASGGVEVTSWQVADKTEVGAAMAPARMKAQPTSADRWWWQ